MNRKARGDGLDDLGRAEHADLDGGDLDVLEDRVDLGADEFRRRQMNAANAFGVLRGEGRDRGHAVAAERCEGFEVGLNAGAAARIRPGD